MHAMRFVSWWQPLDASSWRDSGERWQQEPRLPWSPPDAVPITFSLLFFFPPRWIFLKCLGDTPSSSRWLLEVVDTNLRWSWSRSVHVDCVGRLLGWRSNIPIKESTPLSTSFALLDGLFAEDVVPVSSLATLSCTYIANGSFEVLAYYPVATLLPKMLARRS
jgi:hypothetical protein